LLHCCIVLGKGPAAVDDEGLKPSRVGRPTKFNGETIERLCSALGDGMSIRSACVVAGIGVTTLADWREQKPGLETRMDEAQELARQTALRAIQKAGDKDWRAHAEWLRLAFPADYRGNANRIEVSAAAHASSGFVLTGEHQKELQRRHQEALERSETGRMN
jgi:hypothetical protein